MFRTVSIATLMAPFAGGADFAGYSSPKMMEIIIACGGSPDFDHQLLLADAAYGHPTDRQHADSVQVA